MANKKRKWLSAKSLAFYGTVVIALIVIGYYSLDLKQDADRNSIQTNNNSASERSKAGSLLQDNKSSAVPVPTPTTNAAATAQKPQSEKNENAQEPSKAPALTSPDNSLQSSLTANNNSQVANQDKPVGTNDNNQAASSSAQPEITSRPLQKAEPAAKPIEAAIKILKTDVTFQAKFYPYKLDNINMEVIAVKAGDGSIRTALNTCQVCFDSGRGYYVQVGEYLVCQNCRNKFHIDQVEKVKGGCNPVPVLQENKTVLEDSIVISKDFMAGQKEFFSKWKKQ